MAEAMSAMTDCTVGSPVSCFGVSAMGGTSRCMYRVVYSESASCRTGVEGEARVLGDDEAQRVHHEDDHVACGFCAGG